MTKSGNLSIHTENIFPIIKKFLYSHQEVFLRELVSNAQDATQKLRTLSAKGEIPGELGDLTIEIRIDEAAKTLTISDYGIGMTAGEVEEYINQIAFSSAEQFLEKYKDTASQIIGHFGLGFYSAFMVANKVELVTQSWQPGAAAVHWTCEGSTTFEMQPGTRARRGTDIILHINDDSDEYLKSWRIEEVLRKYCRFLPIPVKFNDQVINDTEPAWIKKPGELTDQDYKNFYQKLYPMQEPPLFWIHLNVDYPFTLTGILYFPRIKPNVEIKKNSIQLYSNQVFITDNVEDIVPDYLGLLQGVIDSPDIPLNVSRSYLQTDAAVRKISSHISRKVADKLSELFKLDRKEYEQKWESIGVFVKYGMVRDNAFYDRVKDACLLYNLKQEFYTIEEYKEKVKATQTDKNEKVVFLYVTDADEQHSYIQAAQKRGYDVLLLDGILDMHLLQYLDHQLSDVSFARVDSATLDKLIDKGVEKSSLLNEEEEAYLKDKYQAVLAHPGAQVECEPLGEDELPVLITRPEHMRRLLDMNRYGLLGGGELPENYTVVINSAHPLARKILLQSDGEGKDNLIRHSYELALLSQGMLTGDRLTGFIQRDLAYMA
ncbi:MAG: molecular chaperone HtpG [Bacteroidetes bacterium]|nr:molecular chaperone HtpG [Bacteroidota bacterium]